jgi:hypothetical protein
LVAVLVALECGKAIVSDEESLSALHGLFPIEVSVEPTFSA